MNKAYLLTGGNMGEREKNLDTAKQLVDEQCGKINLSSSLYETAAWGNTNQPPFLNQALIIETTMNAQQLLQQLLKIEKMMGRIREEKYGPRLIDIDILLFNEEIYNLPFLKVPHPELQNRRFALMPLAEIAGPLIHPVYKKSILKLLDECNDQLAVKKYT